jgi:hypothetical protein
MQRHTAEGHLPTMLRKPQISPKEYCCMLLLYLRATYLDQGTWDESGLLYYVNLCGADIRNDLVNLDIKTRTDPIKT